MPEGIPYPMATENGDKLSSSRNTVFFNASKKELFLPNSGFKTLQSRLKHHWTIGVQRDDITPERLKGAKLIVFGGPRDKFTAGEFHVLREYMDKGGCVLVLMTEGGEIKQNTNINFLLEEFGIMVNNDVVTRTVYYKYFHPKEALISNGVVNREINRAAGKAVPGKGDIDGVSMQSLSFVYPFGATLTVQKPAIAILSSGSTSYPVNRPVCAFCNSKSGQGKLVVMGSAHVFSDQYLDKEENGKLQEVVFRWLTSDEISLNSIDADDPEISDYHFLPDTAKRAQRVQSCLQESEELPRDFTTLFDRTLFKLDTTVLPDVLKAYEQLSIKHEPLSLIQPTFETPLPPLQPAVFPPSFRELPPPALDLFDLDEHFSSERVRIAQITNKCGESDLEYYVRQCGDILGVTSKLAPGKRSGKHILEHVFAQIVEFKKSSQDMMSSIVDKE